MYRSTVSNVNRISVSGRSSRGATPNGSSSYWWRGLHKCSASGWSGFSSGLSSTAVVYRFMWNIADALFLLISGFAEWKCRSYTVYTFPSDKRDSSVFLIHSNTSLPFFVAAIRVFSACLPFAYFTNNSQCLEVKIYYRFYNNNKFFVAFQPFPSFEVHFLVYYSRKFEITCLMSTRKLIFALFFQFQINTLKPQKSKCS